MTIQQKSIDRVFIKIFLHFFSISWNKRNDNGTGQIGDKSTARQIENNLFTVIVARNRYAYAMEYVYQCQIGKSAAAKMVCRQFQIEENVNNLLQYFEDYKLNGSYTGQPNSWYKEEFMETLGLASQIPNVLFSWINIFVNLGWVKSFQTNTFLCA